MTTHGTPENYDHSNTLITSARDEDILFDEFNKVASKTVSSSLLSGLGYWISVKLTDLLQTTGYNKRRLKALTGKRHVLNIGCGPNPDSQLVNSDILPNIRMLPQLLLGRKKTNNDFFLDLPVYDSHIAGSMTGIILSHVLEHIPPAQALSCLQNCYCYLKPDGVIRISVPHLAAYDRETIPPDHEVSNRNLAKNCLVYAYGHRFMYDESLLVVLLKKAGYTHVKVTSFGQGELADTDSYHHKDESIYVTGRKQDSV